MLKTPKIPPEMYRTLVFQISVTMMLLLMISISAYKALMQPVSQTSNLLDTAGIKYHDLLEIPLVGPITTSKAEISGMSWYQDYLILLPQYPEHFGSEGMGFVFALPKNEILAFLDGQKTEPLLPIEIPFDIAQLTNQIGGFEGFEALAFIGDKIFLTIESKPGAMLGYLVKGLISDDLSMIRLSTELTEIEPQADIDNFSDEALIIFQDHIYTFYEANGVYDNRTPVAHIFDADLNPLGLLKSPNLEYRLTDASAPDAEGRFWVINYLFQGDLIKLNPGPDPLKNNSSINPLTSPRIERLVEMLITDGEIILSDRPAINLALATNGQPRNWEALATLDDRGFLIASDRYPKTILGFIAH